MMPLSFPPKYAANTKSRAEPSTLREHPPINRAWYLVAFVVVSFLAGLAIKRYRTGVIYP